MPFAPEVLSVAGRDSEVSSACKEKADSEQAAAEGQAQKAASGQAEGEQGNSQPPASTGQPEQAAPEVAKDAGGSDDDWGSWSAKLSAIDNFATTPDVPPRASKWDQQPADVEKPTHARKRHAPSSAPEWRCGGGAGGGAAGRRSESPLRRGRSRSAKRSPSRGGVGFGGKGKGKGGKGKSRDFGFPGQVCFWHNPREGKTCTWDECMRDHLDTWKESAWRTWRMAFEEHKAKMRARRCSRSRSPGRRGGGGRSHSRAPRRASPEPARRYARSATRARSMAPAGGRSRRSAEPVRRRGRSATRDRSRAPTGRRSAARGRSETRPAAGDSELAKCPEDGSFLNFMYSQSDDVTPAAAIEAFHAKEKEEKLRRATEFFDAHKADGILADLHRGIHLLRAYDWRFVGAQAAAAAFLKDLAAGAFEGLSLATDFAGEATPVSSAAGIASGLRSLALPASGPGGSAGAPHFLAKPDERTMVFGPFGPSLSVWDFHELLQQQPGFADIWLDEPAPVSLLRKGRALFESEAHLQAALEQLAGADVKGNPLRPVRAEQQGSCRVLLAPPAASEPAHLEALSRLAGKAVAVLDGAAGLAEVGTRQLLEASADNTKAQLDLRSLYLRRVHCFCLYSAARCADQRELASRCGAAALRAQGVPWEGERQWAKEHLAALRLFLARAAAEGPRRPDPVPASVEGEPLQAHWETFCKESTKKEAEARFKCLRCSKVFKGEDYLQKHILKVHHDGFCRCVLHVRDERMRSAYFEAQRGPGWQ